MKRVFLPVHKKWFFCWWKVHEGGKCGGVFIEWGFFRPQFPIIYHSTTTPFLIKWGNGRRWREKNIVERNPNRLVLSILRLILTKTQKLSFHPCSSNVIHFHPFHPLSFIIHQSSVMRISLCIGINAKNLYIHMYIGINDQNQGFKISKT